MIWRLFLVGLLMAVPVGVVGAKLPAVYQTGQCMQVNGQSGLNIHSGPGTNTSVLTSLAPGDQIQADYSRAQSDGRYNWVPVQYTGGEGWTITIRLIPCPSDYGETEQQIVLDGVTQDGALDRFEIASIARSVVLVGNLQNDHIAATGTGTIITPDGLVVTNAHVVNGADTVGIALLEDINDPPEYRYLGDVISYDEEIDVALVAIRADFKGNPVNNLNLPYLPASGPVEDVFRGDSVYIFGYPGIGDDYLVVTTGSIVSVENGDVEGQRLPVWYRTDAELAPGNSGGLVVNPNGEFIGIPTFVRAEAETGGRLGGIRPVQVALMAVLNEESAVVAEPLASGGEQSAASVQRVTMDHGAVENGLPGLRIHVALALNGLAEQNAIIAARFYHDDMQSTPLVNPSAPSEYRDEDNAVMVSMPIVPCCDETVYDDLVLFIPYEVFGLTQPGTYPLKYKLEVTNADLSWRRVLSWEYISYTRP